MLAISAAMARTLNATSAPRATSLEAVELLSGKKGAPALAKFPRAVAAADAGQAARVAEPETAAPVVATDPDRELLDLSVELAAARDAFDRTSPVADAEAVAIASAANDVIVDVQRRIIDAPAQTFEGLAIKLRVMQTFVDQRVVLPKPSDDRSQHDRNEWGIASCLWDAERLAGDTGAGIVRLTRVGL